MGSIFAKEEKESLDLSPTTLTNTSVEDKVWLSVTEENLFSNESFTNEKYFMLQNVIVHEGNQDASNRSRFSRSNSNLPNSSQGSRQHEWSASSSSNSHLQSNLVVDSSSIIQKSSISDKASSIHNSATSNSQFASNSNMTEYQRSNDIALSLLTSTVVSDERNLVDLTLTKLIDDLPPVLDSSSAFFDSTLQKRLYILKRIHLALHRERARDRLLEMSESNFDWNSTSFSPHPMPNSIPIHTNSSSQASSLYQAHFHSSTNLANATVANGLSNISSTYYAKSLPIVVRMTVRLLLSVIQKLQNSDELSISVLSTLLEMLHELPPLALRNEPIDSLDAFKDWLSSTISNILSKSEQENGISQTNIESLALAFESLLALSVSKGSLTDLLSALTLCCLEYTDHKQPLLSSLRIQPAPILKKMVDWNVDLHLSPLARSSLVSTWPVKIPSQSNYNQNNHPSSTSGTSGLGQQTPNTFVPSVHSSMTCDAKYLYIQGSHGLIKVGTGFGGTSQGKIYAHKSDFFGFEKGWICCIHDRLYFRSPSTFPSTMFVIDTESLEPIADVMQDGRGAFHSVDNSLLPFGPESSPLQQQPNQHIQDHQHPLLQQSLSSDLYMFTSKDSSGMDRPGASSLAHLRSPMFTEGRYLYILSIIGYLDTRFCKFAVDSYDPLAGMSHVNRIILHHKESDTTASISSVLAPTSLENASYYTNGKYLMVIIPPSHSNGPHHFANQWSWHSYHSSEYICRCFNMQDGSLMNHFPSDIGDYFAQASQKSQSQEQQAVNIASCYDHLNNVIWCSQSSQVARFSNAGIAPKFDFKEIREKLSASARLQQSQGRIPPIPASLHHMSSSSSLPGSYCMDVTSTMHAFLKILARLSEDSMPLNIGGLHGFAFSNVSGLRNGTLSNSSSRSSMPHLFSSSGLLKMNRHGSQSTVEIGGRPTEIRTPLLVEPFCVEISPSTFSLLYIIMKQSQDKLHGLMIDNFSQLSLLSKTSEPIEIQQESFSSIPSVQSFIQTHLEIIESCLNILAVNLHRLVFRRINPIEVGLYSAQSIPDDEEISTNFHPTNNLMGDLRRLLRYLVLIEDLLGLPMDSLISMAEDAPSQIPLASSAASIGNSSHSNSKAVNLTFLLSSIHAKACRVLTVGLEVFYPSYSEQSELLFKLLNADIFIERGHRKLLNSLVSVLTVHKNPSYLLLAPSTDELSYYLPASSQINRHPSTFLGPQSTPGSSTSTPRQSMVSDFIGDEGSNTSPSQSASSLEMFLPLLSKLLKETQSSVSANDSSGMISLIQAIQKDLLLRAEYPESGLFTTPSTVSMTDSSTSFPSTMDSSGSNNHSEIFREPTLPQQALVAYVQLVLSHSVNLFQGVLQAEVPSFSNPAQHSNWWNMEFMNVIQHSVVGPLLPTLLHSLFLFTSHNWIAKSLLPPIIQLVSIVDSIHAHIPPPQLAAKSDDFNPFLWAENGNISQQQNQQPNIPQSTKVVESPHPYENGKVLKQVVKIPGAIFLSLIFDERCSTNEGSDILEIFEDEHCNRRVSHGQLVQLSGIRSKWPKRRVIVPGDTAVFLFKSVAPSSKSTTIKPIGLSPASLVSSAGFASSFPAAPVLDSNVSPITSTTSSPNQSSPNPNQNFWGYRCVVIGNMLSNSKSIQPWSVHLEETLCCLGGQFSSSLIRGDAITDLELKLESTWLNHPLFDNGLVSKQTILTNDSSFTPSPTQPLPHFSRPKFSLQHYRDTMAFLSSVLNLEEDGAMFMKWAASVIPPVPPALESRMAPVKRAERAVMCCILHHSGLACCARELTVALKESKDPNTTFEPSFVSSLTIVASEMKRLRDQVLQLRQKAVALAADGTENHSQFTSSISLVNIERHTSYKYICDQILSKAMFLLRDIHPSVAGNCWHDQPRISNYLLQNPSQWLGHNLEILKRVSMSIFNFIFSQDPLEKEIRFVLETRNRRAWNRASGFDFMKEMLIRVQLPSMRYEILRLLGSSIRLSAYRTGVIDESTATSWPHSYNDHLRGCNFELSTKVSIAFESLWSLLAVVLKDSSNPSLQLVALEPWSIKFSPSEFAFLDRIKIFPILHSLIQSTQSSVNDLKEQNYKFHTNKKPKVIHVHGETRQSSAASFASNQQILMNIEEELAIKQQILSAAHNMFKLLAVMCFSSGALDIEGVSPLLSSPTKAESVNHNHTPDIQTNNIPTGSNRRSTPPPTSFSTVAPSSDIASDESINVSFTTMMMSSFKESFFELIFAQLSQLVDKLREETKFDLSGNFKISQLNRLTFFQSAYNKPPKNAELIDFLSFVYTLSASDSVKASLVTSRFISLFLTLLTIRSEKSIKSLIIKIFKRILKHPSAQPHMKVHIDLQQSTVAAPKSANSLPSTGSLKASTLLKSLVDVIGNVYLWGCSVQDGCSHGVPNAGVSSGSSSSGIHIESSPSVIFSKHVIASTLLHNRPFARGIKKRILGKTSTNGKLALSLPFCPFFHPSMSFPMNWDPSRSTESQQLSFSRDARIAFYNPTDSTSNKSATHSTVSNHPTASNSSTIQSKGSLMEELAAASQTALVIRSDHSVPHNTPFFYFEVRFEGQSSQLDQLEPTSPETAALQFPPTSPRSASRSLNNTSQRSVPSLNFTNRGLDQHPNSASTSSAAGSDGHQSLKSATSNSTSVSYSVGLHPSDMPMFGLPGWFNGSYGYHSSDGFKYSAAKEGLGERYGRRYTENDVIGCGWNRITGTVFFTKGGVYLGTAFKNVINGSFVPVVGINGNQSSSVTVNFGQMPFMFDLSSTVRRTAQQMKQLHAKMGSEASGLALEFTSLLRYLMTVPNSPWKAPLQDFIKESLSTIPSLINTVSSNLCPPPPLQHSTSTSSTNSTSTPTSSSKIHPNITAESDKAQLNSSEESISQDRIATTPSIGQTLTDSDGITVTQSAPVSALKLPHSINQLLSSQRPNAEKTSDPNLLVIATSNATTTTAASTTLSVGPNTANTNPIPSDQSDADYGMLMIETDDENETHTSSSSNPFSAGMPSTSQPLISPSTLPHILASLALLGGDIEEFRQGGTVELQDGLNTDAALLLEYRSYRPYDVSLVLDSRVSVSQNRSKGGSRVPWRKEDWIPTYLSVKPSNHSIFDIRPVSDVQIPEDVLKSSLKSIVQSCCQVFLDDRKPTSPAFVLRQSLIYAKLKASSMRILLNACNNGYPLFSLDQRLMARLLDQQSHIVRDQYLISSNAALSCAHSSGITGNQVTTATAAPSSSSSANASNPDSKTSGGTTSTSSQSSSHQPLIPYPSLQAFNQTMPMTNLSARLEKIERISVTLSNRIFELNASVELTAICPDLFADEDELRAPRRSADLSHPGLTGSSTIPGQLSASISITQPVGNTNFDSGVDSSSNYGNLDKEEHSDIDGGYGADQGSSLTPHTSSKSKGNISSPTQASASTSSPQQDESSTISSNSKRGSTSRRSNSTSLGSDKLEKVEKHDKSSSSMSSSSAPLSTTANALSSPVGSSKEANSSNAASMYDKRDASSTSSQSHFSRSSSQIPASSNQAPSPAFSSHSSDVPHAFAQYGRPLKFSDIKLGLHLTLCEQDKPRRPNSDWVEAMNHLIGLSGIVLDVDNKLSQVLLRFIDKRSGMSEDWWIPHRLLVLTSNGIGYDEFDLVIALHTQSNLHFHITAHTYYAYNVAQSGILISNDASMPFSPQSSHDSSTTTTSSFTSTLLAPFSFLSSSSRDASGAAAVLTSKIAKDATTFPNTTSKGSSKDKEEKDTKKDVKETKDSKEKADVKERDDKSSKEQRGKEKQQEKTEKTEKSEKSTDKGDKESKDSHSDTKDSSVVSSQSTPSKDSPQTSTTKEETDSSSTKDSGLKPDSTDSSAHQLPASLVIAACVSSSHRDAWSFNAYPASSQTSTHQIPDEKKQLPSQSIGNPVTPSNITSSLSDTHDYVLSTPSSVVNSATGFSSALSIREESSLNLALYWEHQRCNILVQMLFASIFQNDWSQHTSNSGAASIDSSLHLTSPAPFASIQALGGPLQLVNILRLVSASIGDRETLNRLLGSQSPYYNFASNFGGISSIGTKSLLSSPPKPLEHRLFESKLIQMIQNDTLFGTTHPTSAMNETGLTSSISTTSVISISGSTKDLQYPPNSANTTDVKDSLSQSTSASGDQVPAPPSSPTLSRHSYTTSPIAKDSSSTTSTASTPSSNTAQAVSIGKETSVISNAAVSDSVASSNFPFHLPGDPVKGYLVKVGKMFRQRKKYYFILTSSSLTWYKNATPNQPLLGYIDLRNITGVESLEKKKKEHEFDIVTPTKTHSLQAASTEEKDRWISCITQHSQYYKLTNTPMTSDSLLTAFINECLVHLRESLQPSLILDSSLLVSNSIKVANSTTISSTGQASSSGTPSAPSKASSTSTTAKTDKDLKEGKDKEVVPSDKLGSLHPLTMSYSSTYPFGSPVFPISASTGPKAADSPSSLMSMDDSIKSSASSISGSAAAPSSMDSFFGTLLTSSANNQQSFALHASANAPGAATSSLNSLSSSVIAGSSISVSPSIVGMAHPSVQSGNVMVMEQWLYPYQKKKIRKMVMLEWAESILVVFDPSCHTKSGYNVLRFYRNAQCTDLIASFSGYGPSAFPSIVIPKTNKFWMVFSCDAAFSSDTFGSSSASSSTATPSTSSSSLSSHHAQQDLLLPPNIPTSTLIASPLSPRSEFGIKFFASAYLTHPPASLLSKPSFEYGILIVDWLLSLVDPHWMRQGVKDLFSYLVSHLETTQLLDRKIKVITQLTRLLQRWFEFSDLPPNMAKLDHFVVYTFEQYSTHKKLQHQDYSLLFQKCFELSCQIIRIGDYSMLMKESATTSSVGTSTQTSTSLAKENSFGSSKKEDTYQKDSKEKPEKEGKGEKSSDHQKDAANKDNSSSQQSSISSASASGQASAQTQLVVPDPGTYYVEHSPCPEIGYWVGVPTQEIQSSIPTSPRSVSFAPNPAVMAITSSIDQHSSDGEDNIAMKHSGELLLSTHEIDNTSENLSTTSSTTTATTISSNLSLLNQSNITNASHSNITSSSGIQSDSENPSNKQPRSRSGSSNSSNSQIVKTHSRHASSDMDNSIISSHRNEHSATPPVSIGATSDDETSSAVVIQSSLSSSNLVELSEDHSNVSLTSSGTISVPASQSSTKRTKKHRRIESLENEKKEKEKTKELKEKEKLEKERERAEKEREKLEKLEKEKERLEKEKEKDREKKKRKQQAKEAQLAKEALQKQEKKKTLTSSSSASSTTGLSFVQASILANSFGAPPSSTSSGSSGSSSASASFGNNANYIYGNLPSQYLSQILLPSSALYSSSSQITPNVQSSSSSHSAQTSSTSSSHDKSSTSQSQSQQQQQQQLQHLSHQTHKIWMDQSLSCIKSLERLWRRREETFSKPQHLPSSTYPYNVFSDFSVEFALEALLFAKQQSVTHQSPHPYPHGVRVTSKVTCPKASHLLITFDPRCCTEANCDYLMFSKDTMGGDDLGFFTGTVFPPSHEPMIIHGESFVWSFLSDANGLATTKFYWGFRFTVTPVFTDDTKVELQHKCEEEFRKSAHLDSLWNHSMDLQFMRFINSTVETLKISCMELNFETNLAPLLLQPPAQQTNLPSVISSNHSSLYPSLSNIPIISLQRRFIYLKYLNHCVFKLIPLLDLSCLNEPWSIAWLVHQSKHLLFYDVKLDLLNGALASSQTGLKKPTIILNRHAAAMADELSSNQLNSNMQNPQQTPPNASTHRKADPRNFGSNLSAASLASSAGSIQQTHQMLQASRHLTNRPSSSSLNTRGIQLASQAVAATKLYHQQQKQQSSLSSPAECLFLQGFRHLHYVDPSRLRHSDCAWEVRFEGEGADDAGGPFRESITQFCIDVHKPLLGLFIPTENQKGKIGINQDKFVPNSVANSPKQLAMLEFLGKLMGVAIRTKQPLELNFPSIVWKSILGIKCDRSDLEGIDKQLALYLEAIENFAASDSSSADDDSSTTVTNSMNDFHFTSVGLLGVNMSALNAAKVGTGNSTQSSFNQSKITNLACETSFQTHMALEHTPMLILHHSSSPSSYPSPSASTPTGPSSTQTTSTSSSLASSLLISPFNPHHHHHQHHQHHTVHLSTEPWTAQALRGLSRPNIVSRRRSFSRRRSSVNLNYNPNSSTNSPISSKNSTSPTPHLSKAQFDQVFFETFKIARTSIPGQASKPTYIDLIPNGSQIPVTWANRKLFTALVQQFRLDEFAPQIAAITTGLVSVVPTHILSLFSWSELELRVCGRPGLDIELLKKHTLYHSGLSSSDRLVRDFWKALSSFTPEEQTLFLRFAWGRSRLPSANEFGTQMFHLQVLQKGATSAFSINTNTASNQNPSPQPPLQASSSSINHQQRSNQIRRPSPAVSASQNSRARLLNLYYSLGSNNVLLDDDLQTLIATNLDNPENHTHESNSSLGDLSSAMGFPESVEFEPPSPLNSSNIHGDSSSPLSSPENASPPGAQSDDLHLPQSHTCFFQLSIPYYSSYDVLRSKLLYAITSCREIDTDFNPGTVRPAVHSNYYSNNTGGPVIVLPPTPPTPTQLQPSVSSSTYNLTDENEQELTQPSCETQ